MLTPIFKNDNNVLAVTNGLRTSRPGFTLKVKTDNAGTSDTNQFTIPTTGTGYNYRVVWAGGSASGLTGDYTITFPAIGTYTIEISGAFPRIFFNDTGDKLKLLEIRAWGPQIWADMSGAFQGCSNMMGTYNDIANTANVLNMANMFQNASAFNQSVANFDTANVISMTVMFSGATVFNQSVANFDTTKVTSMNSMFNNAFVFNQSVANFNTTNVLSMASMFQGASAFNQSVANFDTANVLNMANMFRNTSAFNQLVANFDTANVLNMANMFRNASVFDQSVANFDTTNVTNMIGMFRDASVFDQSVANFDTTNVTNMVGMFQSASVFNQSLANFNILKVTNIGSMLVNTGLSVENYSKTLISWGNQAANNFRPFGLSLGATGLKYSATIYDGNPYDDAVSARTFLTSTRETTVSGAADVNANGAYTISGSPALYRNVNGWYFTFDSDIWRLFDSLDVEQAVGTGGFSSTPVTAIEWTGVEAGIIVTNTGGAGWTISDAGEEI